MPVYVDDARSKWEYDVTQPMLPPNAASPVMDYRQMTDWLNRRAAEGWEFVSYAQTRWHDGTVQEWWIFRRPAQKPKAKRQRGSSR